MKRAIQKATVDLLLRYISQDPIKNLPKMFDIAEKLDRGKYFSTQLKSM
ncbi:MAG: hypothetical protein PWR01_1823 [Clostridiales bacterium]|nr:hypothetical protein [Clostridiales bacterium]